MVFALPGNPVSSLICAIRYVVPFLNRCLGERTVPARVRVDGAAPPRPGWTRFDLGHRQADPDGGLRATLLPLNTSGDLRSLALAEGIYGPDHPRVANTIQNADRLPPIKTNRAESQ